MPTCGPIGSRNDLDQLSGVAHREALLLGDSYVIVWADQFGRPKVTVESAKQVAVMTDPGTRRSPPRSNGGRPTTTTEAVLYQPDRIVRLRADRPAPPRRVQRGRDDRQPAGVVPVVQIRNSDRLLDDGCLRDRRPDAAGRCAQQVLADMMVTSEYVGRPRRWATGIELTEEPVSTTTATRSSTRTAILL